MTHIKMTMHYALACAADVGCVKLKLSHICLHCQYQRTRTCVSSVLCKEKEYVKRPRAT